MPLIIGIFCGKRPMKMRHPMPLRHPAPPTQDSVLFSFRRDCCMHCFDFVNRDIAETAGSTLADQRVNTLQRTATHCTTLHHTATHCNTLQHTAMHCNTLQHTATDTLRIKIFVRFTAQCVAACFILVRFATSEHQISRYRALSREISLF